MRVMNGYSRSIFARFCSFRPEPEDGGVSRLSLLGEPSTG